MNKEKRGKVKIVVAVVVVLLVLCFAAAVGACLGSGVSDSAAPTVEEPVATDAPTATAAQTPTNVPTPTSAAPVEAPPYDEIQSTVESMTEAQWKVYLPSLKGMAVTGWTGWVADVDVAGGTYELQVDMDDPGQWLSTYDVSFRVSEDDAMRLQKGSKVTFSGRIARVFEFLGSVTVILEDVTLD